MPAGLFFALGAKPRSAQPATADWLDLGLALDFGEGPWKALKVRREIQDRWKKTVVEESVYLRRRGSAFDAVSGLCTHTGCLVQSAPTGFACPCHKSDFDQEGKPTGGPAPRPLDRLETKVEDGRVKVRFVRFRPGLSTSEPMGS